MIELVGKLVFIFYLFYPLNWFVPQLNAKSRKNEFEWT